MKNKIIKITAGIIAVFGLAFGLAAPSYAEDICSSAHVSSEVKAAYGCSDAGAETADQLPTVIANILQAIIAVLGLVAVIFIVVGGVSYMTSSGDASKLKKAKDTILYACIGLAVCALAFAIVTFTVGIINSQGNASDSSESSEAGTSAPANSTNPQK